MRKHNSSFITFSATGIRFLFWGSASTLLLMGSEGWSRAPGASHGPGILPQSVVSPGLVGRWSFSEGLGTMTADSSGQGNHGMISGATWVASGIYGSALQFNGTNSFVNAGVNGMPPLNSNLALSWYQRVTATPAAVQCSIALQNSGLGNGLQAGFRNSLLTI